MKYKAIIFDLDGTIIDTEKLWHKVNSNFLAKRQINLSEQELIELQHQLHGTSLLPAAHLIKTFFQLPDKPQEIIHELQQNALKLYEQEVQFIEGFTQFHAAITQKNLPSGIATNADSYTLAAVTKSLNLSTYFGTHIYNSAHVNNKPKPDPALYLHAAEQLEVDPLYCIAIEDSAPGIEAAQRAGMFCIGINTSRNIKNVEKANLIVEYYDQIELEN